MAIFSLMDSYPNRCDLSGSLLPSYFPFTSHAGEPDSPRSWWVRHVRAFYPSKTVEPRVSGGVCMLAVVVTGGMRGKRGAQAGRSWETSPVLGNHNDS